MRKAFLAITSSVALSAAASLSGVAPANAIQLMQGHGVSADSHVIQVQGRGEGPRMGARGGFSARGGPGPSVRGGFQGRAQVAPRGGQLQAAPRGGFAPRAQVQRREFQRRDFGPRVQSRRDGDFRRFDRRRIESRRHFKDRPRIVHRGWSRDRRHRFFGAFLLGVPFGYAAIAAHPCYDWTYGPYGWGYYWNYYRCPV